MEMMEAITAMMMTIIGTMGMTVTMRRCRRKKKGREGKAMVMEMMAMMANDL